MRINYHANRFVSQYKFTLTVAVAGTIHTSLAEPSFFPSSDGFNEKPTDSRPALIWLARRAEAKKILNPLSFFSEADTNCGVLGGSLLMRGNYDIYRGSNDYRLWIYCRLRQDQLKRQANFSWPTQLHKILGYGAFVLAQSRIRKRRILFFLH